MLLHSFWYNCSCPDLGPITKFVPTLTTEKDPNTVIVVVDDDTLYPPSMVEQVKTGGGEFISVFFVIFWFIICGAAHRDPNYVQVKDMVART